MSESTPRITAEYLQQFSHKTVRILGKVTQLRGEMATIDAGGQIQVHLNRVRFLHTHPLLPPLQRKRRNTSKTRKGYLIRARGGAR